MFQFAEGLALPSLLCITFLDAYPHPAFILRINAEERDSESYELVHTNNTFIRVFACNSWQDFRVALQDPSQTDEFKRWISTGEPSFQFELVAAGGSPITMGLTKTLVDANHWICTTVPCNLRIPHRIPPGKLEFNRVLTAYNTKLPSATTDPHFPPSPTAGPSSSPPGHAPPAQRDDPLYSPTDVSQLLEEFDWSKTSLGPRESWSVSLKTIIGVVMNSPFPMYLGWGPDCVSMYNARLAQLSGPRHPSVWGMPLSEGWAGLWPVIGTHVEAAMKGKPYFIRNDPVFVKMLAGGQLPEEHYSSWSLTPVHQEDGTVGGILLTSFDATSDVIAERRVNCFRDIIGATVTAASSHEYASSVMEALSGEAYTADVAFAALYFCAAGKVANEQQGQGILNVSLELGSTLGIPNEHTSIPNAISVPVDLSEDTKGENVSAFMSECPWPFIQAIHSRSVVHMSHLPDNVVGEYERRAFGDQPREAVVIPIGDPEHSVPLAMLVLGLNTRRSYNAVYQEDIGMLRMVLNSTLQATLSREAEAKRARRLAELDIAKTAFFANASHELRTPLTLIGGPLQDSISKVTDKHVKESLQMAQRNFNRLRRLVDSLMDFTRLIANKLEGRFRRVRLGLFTSELASLFRDSIERNKLKYYVQCDDDPDQPVCYIDPDLWEKIVFNIAGNALKFTLEGSITIRLTHTAQHAILSVKDTGVGVPPEDVEKIFQRFHRVQTDGRMFEGTGIGLSLTKELVNLHGGKIHVVTCNDPNGPHGCTFTVTIPFGKDQLPKGSVIDASSETVCRPQGVFDEASFWDVHPSLVSDHSEQTQSQEHNLAIDNEQDIRLEPSATGMFLSKSDIVLLVDDNADMRLYIKSILSQYCTVVEACSGQEALRLTASQKPDIVLSDVMMPVMDGFALLKTLRENKHTSLIPIVFITAKSGDDSRMEGLLSGADDYLVKPFKRTELIGRVHLQIQLGKKRIEMAAKFCQRALELKQLCEMSPVGIFRADKEGRVTYGNPRWYKITGCAGDLSEINSWHENLHPNDKRRALEWWANANDDNPNNIPMMIDFRWRNGDWCECHRIFLGGGEALGTFADITERKKLETLELSCARAREEEARRRAEEAEQRRTEAEERRRAQELLIDVTSHELRQPVSAILNSSSFVHNNLLALHDRLVSSRGIIHITPEFLDEVRQDLEALDAIYQCGLTQERIANDVLTLSRFQLGLLNIHVSNFDLAVEIGRITGLFHSEAHMKKIQLRVHVEEIVEQLGAKFVSTDRSRFAQIITNLASNAIKFTDMSPVKREIDINVSVQLEAPVFDNCEPPPNTSCHHVPPNTTIFIFVSVTDSGPGLDPDDLDRLFQRFQQGSHSHNVFGGSGLGLFVSRQLCSLMGGRIEVVSTRGQGATFRFFIKAATASEPSLTITRLPPSDTENFNSKALHVLVAEDNLINQTILNRQLVKVGCTTVLVSNGRQAIDELCSTQKPFDVILMDIEMPVLDGVGAAREIRALEASGVLQRRHRIFALTGNARHAQIQKIREAGLDDVIIKPYRINDVLVKLRSST